MSIIKDIKILNFFHCIFMFMVISIPFLTRIIDVSSFQYVYRN